MNKILITLALVLSISTISITTQAEPGPYDPSRDAFKDFQNAQLRAEKEEKLIQLMRFHLRIYSTYSSFLITPTTPQAARLGLLAFVGRSRQQRRR